MRLRHFCIFNKFVFKFHACSQAIFKSINFSILSRGCNKLYGHFFYSKGQFSLRGIGKMMCNIFGSTDGNGRGGREEEGLETERRWDSLVAALP